MMNGAWAFHFVEGLGRLSAQAAVLVLMVLLAQWLFGRWLTPRWRCALWLLVVGRLILPASLPTPLSVFNLASATVKDSSAGERRMDAPTSPGPVAFAEPTELRAPELGASDVQVAAAVPGKAQAAEAPGLVVTRVTAAAQPGSVTAPGPGPRRAWAFWWPLALLVLWLAGVAALSLHVVWSTVRVARRFRGLPGVTDPAVLAVLDECRARMQVRARLRLVEGADVRSPALHGVFRPRLLLPAGFTQTFSPSELHYIFLHELAHVKRRDVLMNWVVALLQIAHWFNPLVWYGFARWRADRELACDALALETAGEGRNKEYGRTILRLLEGFTHRAAAPGLVGILEDRRQLQERIGMIAVFVPARRWSPVAVLLLAGLAVVGLTDAQDKRAPLKQLQDNAVASSTPASPSAVPTPPPLRPVVTNGALMKVLVLDAENGQPLGGAEVFAPNYAAFFGWASHPPRWLTDASGVATLHLGEIPAGHLEQNSWFTISVRREGYAPRGFSWSANNKDVRPEMPSQITVQLNRGLTAGGLVRDEQGAPLAGVRVRLFGSAYWHGLRHEYPEYWNDPNDSPATVSDAAGRWLVRDFPRDLNLIRIELIRPDGSSQRFVQEGETDPREVGEPVNLSDFRAGRAVFVLKQGLSVRGRVLDPAGKPLPSVLVRSGSGITQAKTLGERHTDEAGRFEFHHLPPCQLILTAYPTNFAISSTVIEVTANTPEARLSVVPLSPLRLQVLDGDGRPLGGAKISVESYRSEGQLLDFAGTTDDSGALAWSNAPLSSFALVAMTSPRRRQKILITPEQREVTFKLREGMEKEIVINGRVKDARTGSAVRLESVSYQTGDHEGFGSPGEISDSGFRLSVPATRFRPGGSYPSIQLQLVAKGYATLITPWRDFDLGDWNADFALEPATDASRIALLPDGKPAANARVWLGDSFDSLFCNGPNRYYGDRLVKELADANGKFLLPTVPGSRAVIVTHADGFLVTPLTDVQQAREVRLQPWGRVEGQAIVDGKPKSGLRVNLTTLWWTPATGFRLTYNTATGADGRFVFTNVPAGEYKLYRWLGQRRSGSLTESHLMPIVVKAGETLRVQYGGGGRAVIGQAISGKPDQAVDWQRDDHVLILKQPKIPALNSAAFATSAAFRKAYEASFQAPAKLQQLREARTYQLEFERDGSFRADDVPPGTYELHIRVTRPNDNSQPRFLSRPENDLGALAREVIITPGQGAFDLGSLVVPMKEDPASKREPPAELSARTLDGQTLNLGQFKGQYTLITFWASWSERCTEQLAEWNKLRTEWSRESRIAFLSLNLDDDDASARKTGVSLGSGWNLARLDGPARTEVTARFNVETLPAVFLLDPDQRIVGRELEGERLRTAIERVLKKK